MLNIADECAPTVADNFYNSLRSQDVSQNVSREPRKEARILVDHNSQRNANVVRAFLWCASLICADERRRWRRRKYQTVASVSTFRTHPDIAGESIFYHSERELWVTRNTQNSRNIKFYKLLCKLLQCVQTNLWTCN